jgi:uncharacterized protein (UPF0332 family)
MSLEDLVREGRLRRQRTSRKEVVDLFRIVDRDLKDASLRGLSKDRKFTTAYNAVLQAATAILRSHGFRSTGLWYHATTFLALRDILGKEHHELIEYFDACRSKRHATDYDRAGIISEKEAIELLKEARQFVAFAKRWITKRHPEFAR